MAIRVLSVGKKHESWVSEGIERYQKRLKKPFQIEWVFLPHSSQSDAVARQEESERILSRIRLDDYVILMDETGEILNSHELAESIRYPIEKSKNLTIIIGGAYGVDQTVLSRADIVWSLSRLVFPHQLVRLILVEQVYRSQEILSGNPYHHQ